MISKWGRHFVLWLMLAIAAIIILPTSIATALAPIPLNSAASQFFADDFSQNPNTSGKWTIYRYEGNQSKECSWNQKKSFVYLTRAAPSKACAMFANKPLNTIARLPARSWTASFRFKVGGGTTNAGDGFVFLFYKKSDPYVPGKGGNLGFQTNLSDPIPGYGIEFDGWENTGDPSPHHVALIINRSDSHKCSTDFFTEDFRWHTAVVKFIKQSTTPTATIKVSIDGQRVLTCKFRPNFTYRGFGFSASTEEATNNHIIDSFMLTLP